MHNNNRDLERYDYSGGFENSPLGSLSPMQQIGIIGSIGGGFGLAILDSLLGWQEWTMLPEATAVAAIFIAGKFYCKKQNIDPITSFKNLNWNALLPGYEPPIVEGSIAEIDGTGIDAVVIESEIEPEIEPEKENENEEDQAPDADCIFFSATLTPHADTILSNRIAALGIPGAGKSNLIAVISEELGKFGSPLIIFDTENEYRTLCDRVYFHRPYAANKSNVNLENAFSFGQRIMDERLQVVLNLDSYNDDDLAALIMIDIIKGIQSWEEQLENDDRIPCTIELDEAAVWFPQNAGESMLSKKEDENGDTLLAKLQKAFFSIIVRRGRKRGIGLVVASQRPAEVDKRLIASCQWKFLLQQNNPNDFKVYKEFGVENAIAQGLRRGEAFVIGPGIKGVHQIRKRRSPDNAKTPGLESLRKKRYTENLKRAMSDLPNSQFQARSDPESSFRSVSKPSFRNVEMPDLSDNDACISGQFETYSEYITEDDVIEPKAASDRLVSDFATVSSELIEFLIKTGKCNDARVLIREQILRFAQGSETRTYSQIAKEWGFDGGANWQRVRSYLDSLDSVVRNSASV